MLAICMTTLLPMMARLYFHLDTLSIHKQKKKEKKLTMLDFLWQNILDPSMMLLLLHVSAAFELQACIYTQSY